MNKINFNRVFRIGIGSTLSYLLCSIIGLEYSASAAVITLLSTQDTKKETVSDVAKRILSYLYAMVSAFILFTLIGYNALAFLIFMLLLVAISYLLGWTGTLSSSTVVTTHFLMFKNFHLTTIYNEVMLLVIGTAFALILNVFFKDMSKKLERDREIIETDIANLIKHTVEYIKGTSEFDTDWIAFIYQRLEEFRDDVINNSYNVEFEKSHYYNEYAGMRKEQCRTLSRIRHDFEKSPVKNLPMSDTICNLMIRVSQNLHKKSTYKDDLFYINEVITQFEKTPLPTTKDELLTYACTLDILQEIYFFVNLNYKFVKQLTAEQLETYWS